MGSYSAKFGQEIIKEMSAKKSNQIFQIKIRRLSDWSKNKKIHTDINKKEKKIKTKTGH